MSKKKVEKFTVEDFELKCNICGHDQFWSRKTLMNTPWTTFFGFDWANKPAKNYVCDKCGYIHWFMPKDIW